MKQADSKTRCKDGDAVGWHKQISNGVAEANSDATNIDNQGDTPATPPAYVEVCKKNE